MLVGVLAAVATGALWGLTFVAPHGVAPYAPVDLAVLRYLVFALASALVLALLPRTRPRGLPRRDLWLGILIGILGFDGYFALVIVAVRNAGTQLSALVVGLLPICLMLAGNRGPRRVPLAVLRLPMLLIGAGLLLVNAQALEAAPDSAAVGQIGLGLLAAAGCLAIWVAYAIINAQVMQRHPRLDTAGWTALQGLGAGLGAVLLGLAAWPLGYSALPELGVQWPQIGRLLAWSFVLGTLGSWFAGWAWIIASRRLPLSLTGQLIVTETVFALIYGFLWEGRLPSATEAAGAALLILGVTVGVSRFHRAGAVARLH